MRDDEVIAAFVRTWLASPNSTMPWLAPQAEWVRPLAHEHRSVPLYLDWTAVVFAREDGEVCLYDTEWNAGWSRASAWFRRMALKRASLACAALVPVLPARPEHAVTCDLCSGTGRIKDPLICRCGGYGWLIPSEDLGMAIG